MYSLFLVREQFAFTITSDTHKHTHTSSHHMCMLKYTRFDACVWLFWMSIFCLCTQLILNGWIKVLFLIRQFTMSFDSQCCTWACIQILCLSSTLVYCRVCSIVSYACLSQSKARVRSAVRRVFQTGSRAWRGKWCTWTQGKNRYTVTVDLQVLGLTDIQGTFGNSLPETSENVLRLISSLIADKMRLFMLDYRETRSA